MKKQFNVLKGKPHPYGITPNGQNCINIAIAMQSEDCGIILYHKNKKQTEKIPFDKAFAIGELYCVAIEGIDTREYEYCFYDGENIFVDSYARCVFGNEDYGNAPRALRGVSISLF